jgi:ABC-2 type transport system permease protein
VNAFLPLVVVTLRGLLGRRRLLLMVLLAALPVALALLVRVAGSGRNDASPILDNLIVRTVLPLVALVMGTAALGSEIDDGTIVHLLVKPIARRWIVLATALVAAGMTAILVVPAVVLTGLLTSGLGSASLSTTFAFAVASLLGAIAYTTAFLALSTVTSRALVIGLVYTLIWEGVVAGLLEGTRFLSIRQATLGVAAALGGKRPGSAPLEPTISFVILAVVTAGALLLATRQLARYEVSGGD